MDKYTERQTELLLYLNGEPVEPNEETKAIAEIFGIEFYDFGGKHGWYLVEDKI